mgnify:CR=1 FL=1
MGFRGWLVRARERLKLVRNRVRIRIGRVG